MGAWKCGALLGTILFLLVIWYLMFVFKTLTIPFLFLLSVAAPGIHRRRPCHQSWVLSLSHHPTQDPCTFSIFSTLFSICGSWSHKHRTSSSRGLRSWHRWRGPLVHLSWGRSATRVAAIAAEASSESSRHPGSLLLRRRSHTFGDPPWPTHP